jgi:hypothetical protein
MTGSEWVAGLLAVALVAWVLRPLRGMNEPDPAPPEEDLPDPR